MKTLTASRLIGIPKKPSGTRPIALGDVILKIAEILVLDSCKKQLARKFHGLQYGVAFKGGCEYIVHQTRDFVRDTVTASLNVGDRVGRSTKMVLMNRMMRI